MLVSTQMSLLSFPSAGLQARATNLRPDSVDWFQNPFRDQHPQLLHVLAPVYLHPYAVSLYCVV